MKAAQRLFVEQTLTAQMLIVSLPGVGLACLISWLACAHAIAPTLAAAGAGLLTSGVALTLTARASRHLMALSDAARTMNREEDAQGHDIPLVESSAELRQMTVQWRRMVAGARRRRQELEEHNKALSGRLELRTHELSTLQDLSVGLATKSDLHELVDEALGALEQTVDYASASLWARGTRAAGGHVMLLGYRTDGSFGETQDLTGMRLSRSNLLRYEQIEREREPIIENRARQSLLSWLWSKVTDDARSSALYRASRSWMAVPLKFREQVLGVMRIDHHEPDFFDDQRARLLTAVGSQTALAMRHAELLAQEREVAIIAERNRIARDLHDAVSQTLFAANMMASTLARAAGRDQVPDAQSLAQQASAIEKLNRGALAEMRLLMFELRPDALQTMHLSHLLELAIEALSCRDVEVESSLATQDGLSAATRVQLYRIAQEALSNIARHSGAKHAVVQWRVTAPDQATLRIADDGKGFDPATAYPGHFGLENMRTRAQEIGATYEVNSVPGEGTEIKVQLNSANHGT